MRMSSYQERFWYDWLLNPLSPKYNESLVFTIKGRLNLHLLELGLNALSCKHPMLRSKFYESKRGPHFRFIENFKVSLEVEDVESSHPEVIFKSIQKFLSIPFDLRLGPLWRVRLLRLDEQQCWLAVSLHHIIIDGNSFEIFRNDLSKFYNQPHTIKQVKELNQYELDLENYMQTEKNWGIDRLANQKISYYEEKMIDIPLHYQLGGNLQEQTTFFFPLDSHLSGRLEKFCLKNRYTLFRFMSAVFAVFLYRYFGQKKFSMVYPVNMKKTTEHNILGSFINMQIFPMSLEPNNSFEEVYNQILESRESTKALSIPYEKIINQLKQKGIIDQLDLANVVVSETDLKLRTMSLNDLEVTSIQAPKTSLPYEISLEFESYENNIYIQLGIKNHWFNIEHHKDQIKNHFCCIIDSVEACFQTPIQKIPLCFMKQTQLQKNLELSTKSEMRIEQKFDQIVEQYPDQTAIIEKGKNIAYCQLSQMVDQIAVNLHAKLNNTAKLVGISMQHSTALIAVMLALFKLGKAYLPIRPDLPISYINEIVAQSKLICLITDQALGCELDNKLIVISIKELLVDVSVKNKINEVYNNNDAAYVLYTSGTTGAPKGVVVKHNSIVNLMLSCQRIYNFSCQDVIPWFHSYAFDFSVWEIWSALLNGATLLILDELVTKSPRDFTSCISQHKVTVINQTPTALKQWATYVSCNSEKNTLNLSSVRAIISGGEALYPYHVGEILEHKTPLRCQIFNMYGITEDSIHSTVYEVTKNYLNDQNSVVGKMLPGKFALVVDENNNIKPMGCPGELLISGFGLANGYLYQPLMTQEKFIRLPEIDVEKKWLKTGDYVRVLPSGNLEYIGRKDAQVKIRGYRIDYKNIEMRLSKLEGVINIKILVKTVENNNELLAFFVLDNRLSISEIILLARENLPYYMVPGRFIKVDEFPRTINNKIDENRLLEICKKESEIILKEKISDGIMQKIFQIWEKILPKNEFDYNDNFFDCGGNSILLVSLQQSLENEFSIRLPIIKFFNYPTIADMTKMIKQYVL